MRRMFMPNCIAKRNRRECYFISKQIESKSNLNWISVNEKEPERGQKCFVKGLEGDYYAGRYGGKNIANETIFWIPSGSMYVRADYYIPIFD